MIDIYGYALQFYIPSGENNVQIVPLTAGRLLAAEALPPSGTIDPAAPAPAKAVSWNEQIMCWLSPDTVQLLRERITKKMACIHVELSRTVLPKFAAAADTAPMVTKVRGRLHIEGTTLLFPKVMSMKGRYAVERFPVDKGDGFQALLDAYERPHISSTGDDFYKELGTTVGIEFTLDRPLLGKKKLQPVSVHFLPFAFTRVCRLRNQSPTLSHLAIFLLIFVISKQLNEHPMSISCKSKRQSRRWCESIKKASKY